MVVHLYFRKEYWKLLLEIRLIFCGRGFRKVFCNVNSQFGSLTLEIGVSRVFAFEKLLFQIFMKYQVFVEHRIGFRIVHWFRFSLWILELSWWLRNGSVPWDATHRSRFRKLSIWDWFTKYFRFQQVFWKFRNLTEVWEEYNLVFAEYLLQFTDHHSRNLVNR